MSDALRNSVGVCGGLGCGRVGAVASAGLWVLMLSAVASGQQFHASMPLTLRFGLEADFANSTRVENVHADMDVPYTGGGTFASLLDPDNGSAMPTTQAHAYTGTLGRRTMPSNPIFSFIGGTPPSGSTPGSTIWVMPQNFSAGQIYLGLAAETISPGALSEMELWNPGDARGGANSANRWIEVRLLDVRGPGHFSMWFAQSSTNVTRFMSTFVDGIDASDVAYVSGGGHLHYNWGFTAPGLYEIDVQLRTLTNLNWLKGDANLDGRVDRLDYDVLVGNFGQRRDWFHADFSGDGVVDLDDFFLLQGNWGTGTGGLVGPGDLALAMSQSPLVSPSAVPEPLGAMAMWGVSVLALARRRG